VTSTMGKEASETFGEQATAAARAASETLSEATSGLDEQIRRMMREHPVLALAGAVAAGFFVGRVVTRPQS
jgi:hypothetical protein